MNEASVRTTSPYSSYPAWQWMEEDYIFAWIFASILRTKILAHFCSKWAQISSNPPLCSAPGQICTHAAENNVLYETVRNNFTKKWKRFSENWNIEVPFTFICKLQTVPSTDSKNMNCVLFIFYYNCIQVLKETSAIRVVNHVRFKPAKDRKCSKIKIVPKKGPNKSILWRCVHFMKKDRGPTYQCFLYSFCQSKSDVRKVSFDFEKLVRIAEQCTKC